MMRRICNRRVLGWSLFALLLAGLAWALYAALPPEPRWILRGALAHGGFTPDGKTYITRTPKVGERLDMDDVLGAPEHTVPVGPVQYWDIATGAQVKEVLGERGPVWHVGFSRDCKQLAALAPVAAGAGRCELRWLDLDAGRERRTVFERPPATWQPWISPGGGLLLLQDWNSPGQGIYVYETASLRLLAKVKHPRGWRLPWKWTPDGNAVYLYIPDGDGNASLRRIAADGETKVALKNVYDWLALAPNGKTLLTWSAEGDGRVLVWDLPAGTQRGSIPLDPFVPDRRQVFFTPDSRTLFITKGETEAGTTFGVWDMDRAQWLGKIPFMEVAPSLFLRPNVVVVHEAEGRIAGYRLRPFARLWQHEGKKLRAAEGGPDSGHVIVLSLGNESDADISHHIVRSRPESGDRLLLLDAHTGTPAFDLALDPEGNHWWHARGNHLLVISGDDERIERGPIREFIEEYLLSLLMPHQSRPIEGPIMVRVFDVTTGDELSRIKLEDDVDAAALTPDGRTLVLYQAAGDSGGSDAAVICYDVPPRRYWRFILGIPLGLGVAVVMLGLGWRRWRAGYWWSGK